MTSFRSTLYTADSLKNKFWFYTFFFFYNWWLCRVDFINFDNYWDGCSISAQNNKAGQWHEIFSLCLPPRTLGDDQIKFYALRCWQLFGRVKTLTLDIRFINSSCDMDGRPKYDVTGTDEKKFQVFHLEREKYKLETIANHIIKLFHKSQLTIEESIFFIIFW